MRGEGARDVSRMESVAEVDTRGTSQILADADLRARMGCLSDASNEQDWGRRVAKGERDRSRHALATVSVKSRSPANPERTPNAIEPFQPSNAFRHDPPARLARLRDLTERDAAF